MKIIVTHARTITLCKYMYTHVSILKLLEKLMSMFHRFSSMKSSPVAAALLLAITVSAGAAEMSDAQAQAQAVIRNAPIDPAPTGTRVLNNQQLETQAPADAQQQAMQLLVSSTPAFKSHRTARAAARTPAASIRLAAAGTGGHGDAQSMAGQLLSGRAPN